MNIIPQESGGWGVIQDHGSSAGELIDVVRQASRDAVRLLPPLSLHLKTHLDPDPFTVSDAETGVTAFTWNAERISLFIDPVVPFGTESLKKYLRGVTFYAVNQAARRVSIPFDTTNPSEVIFAEGIAHAFQRDHSGHDPAQAHYEDSATMWRWWSELAQHPNNIDTYTFPLEDGRKWVAQKVGVWLIDKIIKEHHVTYDELTIMDPNYLIDIVPPDNGYHIQES